jgi:hypothetical protein
MHRLIVSALLVSQSSSAQPKPPKPKATLAVVEVIQRFDECSGAGGEHFVLRIHDGGKPRLAHAGGHASYLGLLGTPQKPRSTFYVAELELLEPPRNPSSKGWCLDRMPTFHADARRLVIAKSRADAEQLLVKLAAKGLPTPAPTWGTTVIEPPK